MRTVASGTTARLKPTGPQLRAARALVGLSAADIAGRAGISLNSVKRAEACEGEISLTAANTTALVRALYEVGVELVPADQNHGEGVRRVKD